MNFKTNASKLSILTLIVALVSASTGCATLFASGPDPVQVLTNPPGAYVYVNGMIVGQTPTVVHLERNQPGQIQIYLPGYRPLALVKHKSVNGWFVVNLLFFIGFFVDLATGDWQRFDSSGIAVGLTPEQGPPPAWYQPPQQQYPQPQPYQDPNYPPPPIYQPPPPGPAPVQPGAGR